VCVRARGRAASVAEVKSELKGTRGTRQCGITIDGDGRWRWCGVKSKKKAVWYAREAFRDDSNDDRMTTTATSQIRVKR